ncbi:Polysaccharide biosynthesis C-terminal domain protein [Acididesulfobacillus acetoxydans]|uniref:Polysaccharide biosynthesis C-terminal domain protein n=1 Tax=Acididesulfobacillus acetoxydans TaxID=1561005 RepID=A0A8S0W683_9FIRM|nr:flippase [Acididesulfobacillus acetoxydans]CAA7599589.1 Polysaccharide biosynthesis C-terminal domain protein [Acididesulfobacillus acetoxydans]CEJ07784.1 Polysaccharide biosynthesis protein [Acididesulfobacillus acetoxydans]
MRFVRSAALTFIGNLTAFLLTLLSGAIVSRWIGPAGWGVVNVSTNFISFASLILGWGLASANVYLLGRNRETLPGVLGDNLLLTVPTAFISVLFYFLNLSYHFQFLRGLSNFQLLVVLFTVPVFSFKASVVNIFLGMQDIGQYNRLTVLDRFLNLLFMVLFLLAAATPTFALLGALAGVVLLSAWELHLLIGRKGVKPVLDRGILRGLLGYGVKAQVGNTIQKLNYRLDVFIVNYFLPLSQVGIYGAAVLLAETLWGVSASIATVIFPLAAAAGEDQEMHVFTSQVTRISFMLISCFSLLLGLISRPLIDLMYGSGFAPAVTALLLLLPGIAVFSISNILANYLAGVGLAGRNTLSATISSIVTIFLDLVLIPRIGINGASIATSLSYATFTFTTLLFYLRFTHSRWRDVLVLKAEDVDLVRAALKRRLASR